MNALKPRASFQALAVSEESRLGREAIETAYALKQLAQAGVRVFFYLEDRERTLDCPTDKIMLSLTAFADQLEREKARQRTYDAMLRKAGAGHVTGGAVFGYSNIEILGPDGGRSHVERRINDDEAHVIQRIFQMCADGHGLTSITKTLNAESTTSPRAQRGPSARLGDHNRTGSVFRPLYRREIVWNQIRGAVTRGTLASFRTPERYLAPSTRALAPGRQPAPVVRRPHDGTIVTEQPNVTWGSTPPRGGDDTRDPAMIFAAIDHGTAECVGIHAAGHGNRFEALEPPRQGVRDHGRPPGGRHRARPRAASRPRKAVPQ